LKISKKKATLQIKIPPYVHNMKRILFAAVVAATVLTGCSKDQKLTDPIGVPVNPGPTNSTDPAVITSGKATRRPLILEETGAWCGYCPNGAITLAELEAQHGEKVCPVALHVTDDLSNPTGDSLLAAFPASGVPNFYVGDADASQQPQNPVSTMMQDSAKADVNHSYATNGTNSFAGKTAYSFPQGASGDYYLAVYIIRKDVLASGGLVQHDYNSYLMDSANTTYWKVAKGQKPGGGNLFNVGDAYHHRHIMMGRATGFPVFGKKVETDPAKGRKNLLSWNATVDPTWGDVEFLSVIWQNVGGQWKFINAIEK